MEPLPSERLLTPIQPRECPGLRLVEWRATPGQEAATGPTPRNVALFGELCKRALGGLRAFTQAHGPLVAVAPGQLVVSISLMPAEAGVHGEAYRNLNDVIYRFRAREKRHDEDGSVALVWGYTRYQPLEIYMRNDIRLADGSVNPGFTDTLAHEIFHVASFATGAYVRRHATRSERDRAEEALALAYEDVVHYP